MAFAWFRKTEGFVPAEGLFQPGRFPAPGWFQPRAFSSLGLLPARGIVQQRVCSRQKLVKNILGMFRAWVFSSSSLVPAPGCFQRGVVSTSGLITPLQLTTQLFPALCALCPNRLQPDLLGVFAVSQLSHLPVPPCCALVDWPVGTPFTVYAYNDLLAVRAAHPPVTVGWPSWHLQLLNPSDWNDLPCPVLASGSWPVSLLMVKCVQAMRERSGHLECRSFVLADSQGTIASPTSAVRRAFAPNANILLKMQ